MAPQWFSDSSEAVKHVKNSFARRTNQLSIQNYVNGHQLINNRRRNDPCLPVLPGQDQSKWFNELKANKIWEEVFRKYVRNHIDLDSAYLSCAFFRDMLEEKRITTMLPEVFRLLQKTSYLRYWGFWSDQRNWRNEQSRNILNQRLVSKAWKKAAEDAFLIPLCTHEKPTWHPESWHWDDAMQCRFHRVQQIDNALGKLGSPKSCAPLLRHVVVGGRNMTMEERDAFHSKILRFLDRYGQGIWAFCFSFCRNRANGNSQDFDYVSFRNMLLKMPQLKSLKLEYMDFEVSTRLLNAELNNHPFPSINSLKLFNMTCLGQEQEFLVLEILKRNVQLQGVNFCCVLGRQGPVAHSIWEALQCLHSLEYFRIDLDIHVGDFRCLHMFDWPLKFLLLKCARRGNASDLLSVLNKFGRTLQSGRVEGSILYNDRGSNGLGVVVNLPNLKEFSFPDIRPVQQE